MAKRLNPLSWLRLAILLLASFECPAMPIYISPLPGLAITEPTWPLAIINLNVEPGDTIDNVKQRINDVAPTISVSLQVLLFKNINLEDGRTLSDYNIQSGSTLLLSSKNGPTLPEPPVSLLMGAGLAGLARIRFSTRKPT